MWRPDNWNNPHGAVWQNMFPGDAVPYKAFEAGADAILRVVTDALREIDEMCEGDVQYYNATRHFEEELKGEKRAEAKEGM